MNIAQCLINNAKNFPHKKAVTALINPKNMTYQSLTFLQLEERSNQYANGLKQLGLKKGDKTLLFVLPGLDFPALTFALFKLGAIPVFIDPGMGRKNLLNCIAKVRPTALIGVFKTHLGKLLFPQSFNSIKIQVNTGAIRWRGMSNLKDLKKNASTDFSPVTVSLEDQAAILFTSGGTGIPKGVEYTHKIFNAQLELLKQMFSLTPNDVDIPGFPLFSLFTMGIGMNSCIPLMDASKPAQANPRYLVAQINDQKATFVAGSPAIWERVADYCLQQKITLPTLKKLVMFGAPVSNQLHRKFDQILTGGTTYTPYGATESLPITNISGTEILKNFSTLTENGKGICLGRVIEPLKVKIIPIMDSIIEDFDSIEKLGPGVVGEIIVSGDVVTPRYYNMPKETQKAKIYQKGKPRKLWHRMGDLGYFDENGFLWFCGRKDHRVKLPHKTLYPVQLEAIFNTHKEIKRTALVMLKDAPILYVQRHDKKILKGEKKQQFEQQLRKLAGTSALTQEVTSFYCKKEFPVDVRHNIKIDRLALQKEAMEKLI
jgi:acyl-CoA synthetase (AMP-forming)/AMP-acid ligase II